MENMSLLQRLHWLNHGFCLEVVGLILFLSPCYGFVVWNPTALRSCFCPQAPTWQLRSADMFLTTVPQFKHLADRGRGFLAEMLLLWNLLLLLVWQNPSLFTSRGWCKAHLFAWVFPWRGIYFHGLKSELFKYLVISFLFLKEKLCPCMILCVYV